MPSFDPHALLLGWVRSHGTPAGGEPLDGQTPIIAWRVITSLQLPDLILYIEEISGRRVDVGQLTPGVFRSVDSLCRHFFGEQARQDER